ncbi:MAG: hypothetical protein HYV39_00340 [Candidatus Levybacteria bacterium]|nr:hypothetical protein [Candidatus Levybacteria bacterium]
MAREKVLNNGSSLFLKGADLLLAELQDPENLMIGSAYDGLGRLLTFDGRIPYRQALDSLSPFEQRIMERLQSRQEIQLIPVEPASNIENSCVVIQEGRIGHVSILLQDDIKNYNFAEPHFIIGAIQFLPEEYKSLEDEKTKHDQDFFQQAQFVSKELQKMEDVGKLEQVVSNIRDSFMHTGPLFVYVRNRIYSSFDRAGKNLVDRIIDGGEIVC